MTELSLDLDSEAFSINPYTTYATLRRQSPVHFYAPWGMWLITRYEDVDDVLRRDAEFPNPDYPGRDAYGRSLLQMNGREHEMHRKLLAPFFAPPNVAKLSGRIEEVADELISAFAGNGEADLVSQFTNLFPLRIIGEVLGIPVGKQFMGWANAFTAYNGNFSNDPAVKAAGLDAVREFRELVAPILAERRANPGEDLLSYLTQTEVDGRRFNDEEILTFAGVLITAGSETTNHTIGNLLVNVLSDESQLALLKENPALVAGAFTETVRHSPPTHSVRRASSKESSVGGHTVPAEARLVVFIGSANRDEQKFEDPDRFDLRRKNARDHLGFSRGPHFCIGSGLGRQEAETAIRLMLRRLPNLRFAPGIPPRIEGARHRRPRTLRVQYDPGH